ncbi:MAG: flavodoxin family protein [Desulfobulbus sp.]|nr:flavodoxin family protein [Desulfobulbus sp.]
MKILAFNGSPRLKGNTATMLHHAVAGAQDRGAEVETVNLYKMKFSGCVSCFTCKRLDKARPLVCVVKDDLQPILEKIRTVDAILIATPVYYGSETASTRALIERLCFPYLNYADYTNSHFPRRIPVGLIYTMNVPSEMVDTLGYDVTFGRTRQTLAREFGSCTMVMACNTTQYDDYSRYEANATAEAKKTYRDAHFAEDCRCARELGEQLATGKPIA